MAKTLAEFVNGLPDPQELWDESEMIAKEFPDYNTHINPLMPEASDFAMYKTENGAGAEGVLLVRKAEGGLIDAALLYAYDHESALTANIEDIEGADKQPALQGLPSEFNPALVQGSPLFWNFEDYPATSNHIFATAAVWFVDGAWHHADRLDTAQDFEGDPIDDTKMVRQFYSIFRGMAF
jgi:hypothetical protein